MDTAISADSISSSRARVALSLAAWLALALAVGASGLVSMSTRALVPLSLAGGVLALVALYRSGGALREVARAAELRTLVLFHLPRAPIGAAFLLAIDHGLDPAFGRVAGVGDLLVGALVPVVAWLAPRAELGRRAVRVWNLLALADILLVVINAQRILVLSGHPETLSPLLGLPGMLLPLFYVPQVIATHLLVHARTAP
jgi:hypothetical protein